MKRDIACRKHRPEDLCETLGTSMHQHSRLFWITSLTVYPRALSTKPQVSICANLPCQLISPGSFLCKPIILGHARVDTSPLWSRVRLRGFGYSDS